MTPGRINIASCALWLASIAAALLVHDSGLAWSLFAGWSVAAFLLVAEALRQKGWPTPYPPRPLRTSVASWLLLTALIAAQLHLSLVALTRARFYVLSTVTTANIRGAVMSVQEFCASHGRAPESLAELCDAGLATQGSLISLTDPNGLDSPTGRLEYTSFEYRSSPAVCSRQPSVLIAWEREPWSPLDIRIFLRKARHVAYSDGTVARLDEAAFRRALHQPAR